MSDKPALIVRLLAGNVVIDESNDAALWQRVLSEIRGLPAPTGSKDRDFEERKRFPIDDGNIDPAVRSYARELELEVGDVEGGLTPRAEPPFITLDSRSWETLKRNTPKKGPGGVSPAVLAATALALWARHAKAFEVTTQTVRGTLGTIHLDDPNTPRAISNCHWLQVKGGKIVPHPSQISAGIRMLKAYCRREPMHDAG